MPPRFTPPTVAVIGLGAAGAMTAWQLAERGARVIGIEQFGRVHAHGSSSGESRVFRTAYHEGELYVPMLLESRRLWRELERASGREIFLDTGTLSLAPEAHPSIATTLQCVRDYELPHRVLDATQLRERFPQHRAFPDDIGVLDELGGVLRPEVAVMSALELAEEAGAELHFNTRVDGFDEGPSGVTVHTAEGPVRADKVVVTTGSWTSRILPDLAPLLRIVPLGLTWFMPDDITEFTPDRFPAFLRDHDGVHFFGIPTLDGYSIKVAGDHDWPTVTDLADRPKSYTREQLIRIGGNAAEIVPSLNPEPVRASVHHCVYTPNRMPIVDLNESERVIVAAGLSGHGFKLSPALGVMVAELAFDGGVRDEAKLFGLDAQYAALERSGPYERFVTAA